LLAAALKTQTMQDSAFAQGPILMTLPIPEVVAWMMWLIQELALYVRIQPHVTAMELALAILVFVNALVVSLVIVVT
jgi:hypothetical protein